MEESTKIDPSLRKGELYAAAKENDLGKVRNLLQEHVATTFIDENNGWTALHWGVKHCNVNMVKLLLNHGASKPYQDEILRREFKESKRQAISPNEQDEELQEKKTLIQNDVLKNTPLLWAAFKGSLQIVLILLEDGYSPNDVDALGNNSVHLAAAAGHKRVLQCLIDDGGSANAVNIYKNQPLDMSTVPEIREILQIAMERGASMTRADIAFKHSENMKKYHRHLNEMKSAISEALKFESSDLTQTYSDIPKMTAALANAIQDARDRDLHEDLIAQAETLLLKLDLIYDLQMDFTALKNNLPLRNQSQYVEYINKLESTLQRSSKINIDTSMIDDCRDTISRAHMEYWLSVRIARLGDVARAEDANEHDMNCLRRTIEQASNSPHAVTEELLEQAVALLKRLDCELEIHRALVSVPTYRLSPPVSDTPLPLDYWQEADLGHIKETEGFPLLPPDSTEYIWEHSQAYVAVATCIERLRNSSLNVAANTNTTAIAEAKEKLTKLEKDFKVLEAKDAADKQAAVEIAVKAAKKLKKGKRKGSPKRK